jgi:hypothetical protein
MAQARMPEKHIQMYEIQLKAGANAQFEAYIKKIIEAANKINAPQGWFTAQTELGANGTSYFIFLGFDKWGERDGWSLVPQMLTKAFGEAEAQKILEAGGEAIWSWQANVYTLDEERSWNLEAAAPAEYYQILLGNVKPSLVDEYLMVISELKEAQEAASGPMGIRRESRFGPSWEFYMATPFEKWGDWDSEASNVWGNVAKHHGEAKAQALRETLRNCYESREIFVIRGRPDLSRDAPSTTSSE